MDLQGKVAIVTGGAGNLGAACVRELARQGAAVVATDLPGMGLAELVAELRETGSEALGLEGDIGAETEVMAIVDSARRAFGRIDILVNNAAAIGSVGGDRDLETMTTDYWDEVMAINVRGAMLCAKHVLPAMRERKDGVILNFGSTAALLGDVGLIAYSTTKAALLGFTRGVATTYGKEGIRCNAVCPGSAYSEKTLSLMPAARADLMERTRLTARLGLPQDVAHMVAFLASDKAAYITGQTFVVDGGGTAHQPWVRVS
jgi:NAD(P)-dependent dehydrogenase (short-subunit alcohol dehydrogenase family)